jgi:hypothetical protein
MLGTKVLKNRRKIEHYETMFDGKQSERVKHTKATGWM